MRAVVAATNSADEVQQVINAMYAREAHILYVEITEGTKVTVVYETREEVNERFEREYQQSVAEIEQSSKPKTRKQPTRKQLMAKAQSLSLHTVEIVRNGEKWEICNQYGNNEVLFTCKTALGISRKLTALSWDKQITRLKNEGFIQA